MVGSGRKTASSPCTAARGAPCAAKFALIARSRGERGIGNDAVVQPLTPLAIEPRCRIRGRRRCSGRRCRGCGSRSSGSRGTRVTRGRRGRRGNVPAPLAAPGLIQYANQVVTGFLSAAQDGQHFMGELATVQRHDERLDGSSPFRRPRERRSRIRGSAPPRVCQWQSARGLVLVESRDGRAARPC